VLQRRIAFVRREDLNVSPGKADQVRLEFGRHLADGTAPLRGRIQRQIEDALADLRLAAVDEVGQVGHPDGIDLLAGEKNVKDGIHGSHRKPEARVANSVFDEKRLAVRCRLLVI